MKIILASQSPRRKQFLELMGVEFEVMIATSEEKVDKALSFENIVKMLASQKAEEIFGKTNGDRLVIGSDTIVVCNNEILGKPKDILDAKKMLKKISGNTHTVFTGLCVIIEKDGIKKIHLDYEQADVTICSLSDELIDKYIQTGEPMDKAGSYALQGIGGNFITNIKGNPACIIGLPTNKLFKIFLQENVETLNFKKK